MISRSEVVDDQGPRTSHQFVLDRLRREIINGRFAGGDRLIQSDIATLYGVSTTPVREALRDLATEGLIRLDAHRGAVVHAIDAEEFEEIYEMRVALEPLAIRRGVARITEMQLRRAEALQQVADEEQDLGRWVDLNRRFHSVFVEAADSERLAQVLKQLRDSSSLYIGRTLHDDPAVLAAANEEHRRLLDAVRRGDVEAAVQISVAHLQGTRRAAGETFFEQPDAAASP